MNQNREQARADINSRDIRDLYPFQRAKGSGYICPICGDGTGADGTGLSLKAGKRIKCYKSGCFTDRGEDNLGALKRIYTHEKGREISENEVFSMVLGGDWDHVRPEGNSPLKAKKAEERPEENDQAVKEWKKRTRKYCEDAIPALWKSDKALDYLRGRGFTDESIKRFQLGYDPEYDSIVIPYDKGFTYYMRRKIGKHDFKAPSSTIKGSSITIKEPLYNYAAITGNGDNPIFVVESQLCAMSIAQAYPEASAVALCGLGNKERLVTIIKEKKALDHVYIICLDNDPSELNEAGEEKGRAGQRATEELCKLMDENKIKYVVYNIAGDKKDPNELLQADPDELTINIGKALAQAAEEAQRERLDYIRQNSNKAYTLSFINDVLNNPAIPYISSGFDKLDELLEGGFYEGLYILGAESSVGKSTYALQIGDYVASQGRDVIYFSLEMSQKSLSSKSISRHTFIKANQKGLDYGNCKTSKGISDGSRYSSYSRTELNLIKDAEIDYLEYADKVYIVETSGSNGVAYIRDYVERHIRITGNRPFVIVDYLQLLAAYSNSSSDKQAVDMAIADLKGISRDFGLVVLAISSFNRAGYGKSASMGSFKESGNVEYTGDCLLALEFADLKNKNESVDDIIERAYKEARENRPVKIRVKILKQREGGRGGDYVSNFYMPFCFFIPEGEDIEELKDEQTGMTIIDDEEIKDIFDEEIDVPF